MSNPITINFTLDEGVTAPTRAHSTDAGLDCWWEDEHVYPHHKLR